MSGPVEDTDALAVVRQMYSDAPLSHGNWPMPGIPLRRNAVRGKRSGSMIWLACAGGGRNLQKGSTLHE